MIPNEVVVDLGAIRHNFLEIKRLAGPDTRIISVVKADAYGHGMIPVSRTLEAAGTDGLGVFDLEEGIGLRNAGSRVPILIMMGVLADEVPAVVDYGLTPALFRLDIAEAISRVSAEKGKVTPVHIKIDTGMTRLGIALGEFAGFLEKLRQLGGIRLEGIFSHLAVADVPDEPFTDLQIRRLMESIGESGLSADLGRETHIANSAALLQKKGLGFGTARPGILLYGSPPAEGWPAAALFRPAMTFRSRVVQVRVVPPDTSVSYGRSYVTQGSRTIATIPVGYDDGYSRLLSNRGEVLVRRRRAPVVGRVCMNLTMIDVTGVEGVEAGDEVILMGAQGDERITAEEIAARTGTISYEVYCSIGKSNRRSYIE